MAVLGLRFCARAFSSCGKWGPLFIAVRGPLTIAASLVAEYRLQTRRLSSCGSRAQLLRGMWDLPRPGLEPCPLHWQADSQPLRHQGSPHKFLITWNVTVFILFNYPILIYSILVVILDYFSFLLIQIVTPLYVHPQCPCAEISRNNRSRMDGSQSLCIFSVFPNSSIKYKTLFSTCPFYHFLFLNFACLISYCGLNLYFIGRR